MMRRRDFLRNLAAGALVIGTHPLELWIPGRKTFFLPLPSKGWTLADMIYWDLIQGMLDMKRYLELMLTHDPDEAMKIVERSPPTVPPWETPGNYVLSLDGKPMGWPWSSSNERA